MLGLEKIILKLIGGTRNDRIVRQRTVIVCGAVREAGERLMQDYAALVRETALAEGADAEAYLTDAMALRVAPLAAREWLLARSEALRQRARGGEPVEQVMPEAFALTRFASWLARDHRQFDVQLVAGQVLYDNTIAEEATGEGKTIACYPAIYLASLMGRKVHLVTVNDYLVRRDAEFARPIFDLVGVSVGYITSEMPAYGPGVKARKQSYACDVTYGTNSEFGFDYLRDNMKLSVADQVQGRQDYAIIDEVDNILIDEARTPLIISGPAHGNVERYRQADGVGREIIRRHQPHEQAARKVDGIKRQIKATEGAVGGAEDEDKPKLNRQLEQLGEELPQAEAARDGLVKFYQVELDKKSVHLTHEGISAAQEIAGVGSFYVGNNMEWPHLLEQSLRAHVVYERDKDYVVREGEVVIVDEFTGRLMEGREWSDGLHQAVDAKERVPIKEENQTMATITIQNLFKLYAKLAGMTGTAMTEAEEFMKIYKLDVVTVPTHRPVNRVDYEDRIYGTVEEKFDAIVEEVNAYSRRGRPVLVGTTSIEKSEHLSTMLTRRHGIEHETLNARPENAAREADIVALAGQQHPLHPGSKEMVGNVTIATNMAGRGTDIKLAPGVVWPNCKVPSAERLAELSVAVEDLFPPGSTKCCIFCPQYNARTNCAHCFKPMIDADFPKRGRTGCRQEVPCGVHIVGTERHEARRIDNQLRGRSGRQGDPGSSRFFLSLRDEIMVVFGGDFALKLLHWVGLKTGEAIEHSRVSGAIVRVQKKVEQRNFDIRKNLLEYDEVMDHQRRVFYGRRQQLLEGRKVEELVRPMIRETVSDAVESYLNPDYSRRCMAEWVRQNLELTIRPDQIRGEVPDDLPSVETELRERAKDEIAATIGVTLGEYVDPDADPKEWDLRGLSEWAASRFGVEVSINHLRRLPPEEMSEFLIQAAQERVDQVDLSPLGAFLEPDFAPRSLAEWTRNRFGVELTPQELSVEDRRQAEELIQQAVEATYLRREIEYPPEYAIDITVGQAGVDNAYAVAALVAWVNRKYQAGWTAERLLGKTVEQVRGELVELSERFFTGGELERAVDAFVGGRFDRERLTGERAEADIPAEEVAAFARERFDTAVEPAQVQSEGVREFLIRVGRAYLRRELSELERYVLLQIYDASWIDHLLGMDHLKQGVGLRGFAEQDPKIAYKKEGYRQFQEMLKGVREKVTDMIFKVRLAPEEGGAAAGGLGRYQVSNLVHDQLTAYDNLAQDMAAQRQAAQAAGQTKVQPIIRQEPRVGRNDPCPCGSGKKYKKCCGKGL